MRLACNILKVECLLTSVIWSYGHEAEVYIISELTVSFKPQGNSSIHCILSTPEQNLLCHIICCTPDTISQHYKQKRKPQERYYR